MTDIESAGPRGGTPIPEERFAPTTEDGFRPRRTRTPEQIAQLIADGVVADPKAGIPERVPGENDHVVAVPVARVTAKREDS